MSRMNRLLATTVFLAVLQAALGAAPGQAQAADSPVKVCATVPELGSLVREIGGDRVTVTVFAKGTEDPHFVEPRPSFVKALSACDLYVQLGMGMEIGWAPVLLENARNGRVQPGNPGHLDASRAISPLEVPTTPVTRSMGDVHPGGNPHYLLDPLNGLSVADLIQDRLAVLRPDQRGFFADRYGAFARRLAAALVGEALASRYGVEDVIKLARLYEHGKLPDYLESQGEAALLGGWLGRMRPHFGARVVDDHNLWPYFARRFGIKIVGHLEPKPGIPPTTRHLRELVARMNIEGVKAVITAAHYDPRHAQFLARHTGAEIVPLAHQVNARPGADDYLSLHDYNVRTLSAALSGG